MHRSSEPYVLVVGGGLAGLSAALFLAWQDVPVLLVEKHLGSSPHPRAIGYTARTLELLRAVDLLAKIPQEPSDFQLLRARVASLAGDWFENTSWTPGAADTPRLTYSPCTGASLAQDSMEPLLRQRASELGADIRFGTEVIDWEQDRHGVTAQLRAVDGGSYTVRAKYMIAADGSRSPIRERIAIPMRGRGSLGTLRSVLFRSPLDEYLTRGVFQFEIDGPELKAFLASYNDGRWALMFHDDQERSEGELRAAINQATGRPDLQCEILATGRWELSARVAERFSSGRVFLAGDAAHTLPPSRGGYGANTGIADAHNLGWKLAAVLSGHSEPSLLDSYNDERQPVAWRRHQQIFARPDYKQRAVGYTADDVIIDDDAMEFGQLYRSDVIVGAQVNLPAAMKPDDWAGQPGTRAAHVWIVQNGITRSTLDLFQPEWVVLALDLRWREAAEQLSQRYNIKVLSFVAGTDFEAVNDEEPTKLFGLGLSGACLVRPDGIIAWRTSEIPPHPADVLAVAYAQASAATPVGSTI